MKKSVNCLLFFIVCLTVFFSTACTSSGKKKYVAPNVKFFKTNTRSNLGERTFTNVFSTEEKVFVSLNASKPFETEKITLKLIKIENGNQKEIFTNDFPSEKDWKIFEHDFYFAPKDTGRYKIAFFNDKGKLIAENDSLEITE